MYIPTDLPLLPDTNNLVVLEGVIKNSDLRLIKIDFKNKPLKKKWAARAEKLDDMGRVFMAIGGTSPPQTNIPASQSTRIQFMLGDKKICGWLGRFYFKDGDFVKVVAAKRDDYYECFAVLRPIDKVITTYPWTTRGFASYSRGQRMFLMWFGPMFIIPMILIYFGIDNFITFFAMIIGFTLCLVTVWRPQKRYCAVAEEIFKALGWTNPGDINLASFGSHEGKISPEVGVNNLHYHYKDEWGEICPDQGLDTTH